MLPRACQQCPPNPGIKPTARFGWGTTESRDKASHMLENEWSQMWAQGDTEADDWRVRNLLRVITSRTDRQMRTA